MYHKHQFINKFVQSALIRINLYFQIHPIINASQAEGWVIESRLRQTDVVKTSIDSATSKRSATGVNVTSCSEENTEARYRSTCSMCHAKVAHCLMAVHVGAEDSNNFTGNFCHQHLSKPHHKYLCIYTFLRFVYLTNEHGAPPANTRFLCLRLAEGIQLHCNKLIKTFYTLSILLCLILFHVSVEQMFSIVTCTGK